MSICEYGCGREAKIQFKNGKWCCSEHYSKCFSSRNRASKTSNPWTKGLTAETDPRLKALGKKISKKLKGIKRTPEQIQNWKDSFTEEVRQKYVDRMLGNNNPMKDPNISSKVANKIRGVNHPYYRKKRPKHSEIMKGDNNPSKRPDVRRKLRLKRIKEIERAKEKGFQIMPFFNPAACSVIDEYGKSNGYNFKHAMNGGEHYFKELGYWVDGYDVERNTVIEIDEEHHFDIDGNLYEKDVRRQKEIIEYYGCTFIRIRI